MMRELLEKLFEGHTLSREEAKGVMRRIALGEEAPAHVTAFLSVLRIRSVTVEELKGFRDALLDLALRIDLSSFKAIDLCGTGGDGKGSFNVSTIAAFVVAGAGQKVAKHGNYGASSAVGSSNLLEALGIKLTNDEPTLRRNLEECGICFLHAPLFHPALKNVAPIRKEMGLRTVFNLLGPLANPSSPYAQLIGVYSFEVLRLYDYVMRESSVEYGIIHSFEGYDEFSLTGLAKLVRRRGESILDPEVLGFKPVSPKAILGAPSKEEAAKLTEVILSGNGEAEKESVVIANAALAIQIASDISFEEAVERSKESIKSGKALQALKKLIA